MSVCSTSSTNHPTKIPREYPKLLFSLAERQIATSSPTLSTGEHSVVVRLSASSTSLISLPLSVTHLTLHLCGSFRLGYSCDTLHGDKTQQMRDRAMDRYRNGQLRILIATDVASRGLDVKVKSITLTLHPVFVPHTLC